MRQAFEPVQQPGKAAPRVVLTAMRNMKLSCQDKLVPGDTLVEKLSNPNAKLRVHARAHLSKLHQRLETTFIYVTHDRTEVMTTATRIPVQRDGVLQQGRTPHELYESPNNLFVAGFIGTPHGLLRCQAGGDRAGDPYRGDGFKVRVLEDRAKKLGEYLGKEVIFGIRPEDVHDPEFAPPNIAARQVKAKLDVTELMGNEVFLYLVTCNKTFIDRVDPRTKARVGQEIEAVFNTGNFHLFDRQTETAIR